MTKNALVSVLSGIIGFVIAFASVRCSQSSQAIGMSIQMNFIFNPTGNISSLSSAFLERWESGRSLS